MTFETLCDNGVSWNQTTYGRNYFWQKQTTGNTPNIKNQQNLFEHQGTMTKDKERNKQKGRPFPVINK